MPEWCLPPLRRLSTSILPLDHPSLPPLPPIPPGSALEELGSGIWAKLLLWALPYRRVLYVDADALLLGNVDEALRGDIMTQDQAIAVHVSWTQFKSTYTHR